MATVSLTSFIDRAFVKKVSGVIYSDMIRMSRVTYSYFERPVLFFPNIPILLIIIVFIYALGGSILRRVVPFLRSGVNNRRVSYDVTNVYYLNLLIGVFFNKIALLFIL